MNKFLIIAVVLAALLGVILFTGKKKDGDGGPSKDGKEPGKGGSFSVGLVTPGAVTDGGWSENAFNGVKQMEAKLGATYKNTVAGSPVEALEAFRSFADRDTNLIIGHASEWFSPKTLEIAKAHPKTVFLISGSERAEANVAGVRFVLEDGTYVLGQIAASMSKTGVIACIGPIELPVIESTFYAFAEGAKSVRPDIKVEVKWVNSWDDNARAKEIALNLIDQQNADFIIHNANDCAKGIFEAVNERKAKGVYAFGTNADQSTLKNAEEILLASAVLDIPAAFLSVGEKVKAGTFDSKAQFLGMPEGFVWVAYNGKLESKIPADVKKRAEEMAAKIKKGEFKVPRRELK